MVVMKLLASFQGRDVDPAAPVTDVSGYKPRTAGRAIIFDGEKVALLFVSKSSYYTLPGGGVEGEDVPAALAREVMEEVGCSITIDREVGSAVVYFDRWQNKQTDYCYTAQKTSSLQAANHTTFEKEEGYQLVWAPSLEQAVKLMDGAVPENLDGKLVRARDLLFLQTAGQRSR